MVVLHFNERFLYYKVKLVIKGQFHKSGIVLYIILTLIRVL